MFALEPEAASMYCRDREQKLNIDFKKGQLVVPMRKFDLCFCCQAPVTAWWTLAVARLISRCTKLSTTAEWLSSALPQGAESSGCARSRCCCRFRGAWGSTYIDKAFGDLLGDLVGKETVRKYTREHFCDWLELMATFESRKLDTTNADPKDRRIRLPRSFLDAVENLSELVEQYGQPDMVSLARDDLKLSHKQMVLMVAHACFAHSCLCRLLCSIRC